MQRLLKETARIMGPAFLVSVRLPSFHASFFEQRQRLGARPRLRHAETGCPHVLPPCRSPT